MLRQLFYARVGIGVKVEELIASGHSDLRQKICHLLEGRSRRRTLFECHITYDKVTPEERQSLEDYAASLKWKTSFIEGDPLLGPGLRMFLTCHSADGDQLYHKMKDVVLHSPVKLIREKIEEIVHDTKYDIWYEVE
jgi:hypothetical protein